MYKVVTKNWEIFVKNPKGEDASFSDYRYVKDYLVAETDCFPLNPRASQMVLYIDVTKNLITEQHCIRVTTFTRKCAESAHRSR